MGIENSFNKIPTSADSESNQEPSKEKLNEEYILLFRGTDQERGRAGRWWSTDPYYAFRYRRGEKGRLYVAKVLRRDLEQLASDVSIEGDFQNYFFKDSDPPGTRDVTEEEQEKLKAHTRRIEGLGPGGAILERPQGEAALTVGKEIFLQQEMKKDSNSTDG